MKLPNKTLEKKLFKSGYQYVFGVDEVGMGCLAGPVVVCTVSVTKDFYKKSHPRLRGLRESKLLSAIQRERFAKELVKEKDFVYAISCVSSKVIDKINIYQAAREAMRNAIKKLIRDLGFKIHESIFVNHKSKIMVLVDGPHKIKVIEHDQQAVIKGDRKVFAIACASIIAKVHRDKMMARYAKKYPNYGFEKHKGYGTRYHQVQLVTLGPCEIHRRSFAPMRKLV